MFALSFPTVWSWLVSEDLGTKPMVRSGQSQKKLAILETWWTLHRVRCDSGATIVAIPTTVLPPPSTWNVPETFRVRLARNAQAAQRRELRGAAERIFGH